MLQLKHKFKRLRAEFAGLDVRKKRILISVAVLAVLTPIITLGSFAATNTKDKAIMACNTTNGSIWRGPASKKPAGLIEISKRSDCVKEREKVLSQGTKTNPTKSYCNTKTGDTQNFTASPGGFWRELKSGESCKKVNTGVSINEGGETVSYVAPKITITNYTYCDEKTGNVHRVAEKDKATANQKGWKLLGSNFDGRDKCKEINNNYLKGVKANELVKACNVSTGRKYSSVKRDDLGKGDLVGFVEGECESVYCDTSVEPNKPVWSLKGHHVPAHYIVTDVCGDIEMSTAGYEKIELCNTNNGNIEFVFLPKNGPIPSHYDKNVLLCHDTEPVKFCHRTKGKITVPRYRTKQIEQYKSDDMYWTSDNLQGYEDECTPFCNLSTGLEEYHSYDWQFNSNDKRWARGTCRDYERSTGDTVMYFCDPKTGKKLSSDENGYSEEDNYRISKNGTCVQEYYDDKNIAGVFCDRKKQF